MFSEKNKKILTLLDEYKEFIHFQEKTNKIPSNYAEIQQAGILQELCNEVVKLSVLFNNKSLCLTKLQKIFLEYCETREQQNQDSCLSYTALFEGECNQLYWKIAVLLFNPSNLGEMLGILLPSVKKQLGLEFLDELNVQIESQKLEDKIQISLQEQALSTLSSHPFEPTLFNQVVIGEQLIFKLDAINHLPFFIHQHLFKALDVYPQIKKRLYSHNTNLKQIAFDNELLETQGITAFDAITRFVKELTRAGSRNTGSTYAGASVFVSCVQFRSYLDQLPEESKNHLFAAGQGRSKTEACSPW